MSDTDPSTIAEEVVEPTRRAWAIDLARLLKHPNAPYFLFAIVALCLAFWPLLPQVVKIWLNNEYYSHGFLIPLMSVYVIYRAWPRISSTPIKPSLWGFPVLLVGLAIEYVGYVAETATVQSWAFMVCLWAGVLIALGRLWARIAVLPILLLAFGLPTFAPFVDEYTNPMQTLSTQTAFQMLKLLGFAPYRPEGTTIYLNNFVLDVAAPCSGLKLVVALASFVAFFLMIARLKWWSNLLLVAITLPLSIFINGLRIALIGLVGNTWGAEAGHTFHDSSGIATLLVCFFLLFQIVRLLGWEG